MTASQGLRAKGPNTPFDTLKLIEDMLGLVLTKQPDGRWRYPDKQNDHTIAEKIGHGATHSAVRKMRVKKHPGGLVVQQIRSRTSPVAAEVEPEPHSPIPVEVRLATIIAEQVQIALAPVLSDLADIKRLWA